MFPRKGTWKENSIPPHLPKEVMVTESPAHLLPGAVWQACLARGFREAVSPSQGAEQPAWRPPSSLRSLSGLPACGVTKQPTGQRAGEGMTKRSQFRFPTDSIRTNPKSFPSQNRDLHEPTSDRVLLATEEAGSYPPPGTQVNA